MAKEAASAFATPPAQDGSGEERAAVFARLREAWQRRYGLIEAG
jgi:ATP-dependent DNA helicase RecG